MIFKKRDACLGRCFLLLCLLARTNTKRPVDRLTNNHIYNLQRKRDFFFWRRTDGHEDFACAHIQSLLCANVLALCDAVCLLECARPLLVLAQIGVIASARRRRGFGYMHTHAASVIWMCITQRAFGNLLFFLLFLSLSSRVFEMGRRGERTARFLAVRAHTKSQILVE